MKDMKTKTCKKWMLQSGIFLSIFLFTILYVLKNSSPTELHAVIGDSRPWYLLLAVGMMCLYFLCEGRNIMRGLQILGYRQNGRRGIRYAVIGFFFSSVTPSASGGQPMQLYQMHKDGIAIGHGTAALMLEFISYQSATVVLALGGLFLQRDDIFTAMGKQTGYLFAGLSLNLITTILVYLLLFFPSASNWLLRFGWVKEKFGEAIKDYQNSAALMKSRKDCVFPYFFTTVVQMTAMYSIPYFVYLSLGLREYHWIQVTAMQAVLYVSVSALPIPGAMGITESGFVKLFRMLFPASLISGAMVLSRGISFYLFVLLGGIYCGAVFARRK